MSKESLKKSLEKEQFKLIFDENKSLFLLKEKDGIIFEISTDSFEEDDIKELLLQEIEHHLKMIEIEDKNYFDDCDSFYLKGDWKKLLLKIKKIVNK